MKAVSSIIFLLFCINCFGQQEPSANSNNTDSITVEIDSIAKLDLQNNYDNIRYLEIVQSRASLKKHFINDNIGKFKNLEDLFISTKRSLSISSKVSTLCSLKQVIIASNILGKNKLSFYGSRTSLSYLKIINYGEVLVLPNEINIYLSLKTLVITEYNKKIDRNMVILFFEKVNTLNLDNFGFTLPNISKREKNTINKELQKRKLKYQIL